MAQITDASLRETITGRLNAVHVDVTDMSGMSSPSPPPPSIITPPKKKEKNPDPTRAQSRTTHLPLN